MKALLYFNCWPLLLRVVGGSQKDDRCMILQKVKEVFGVDPRLSSRRSPPLVYIIQIIPPVAGISHRDSPLVASSFLFRCNLAPSRHRSPIKLVARTNSLSPISIFPVRRPPLYLRVNFRASRRRMDGPSIMQLMEHASNKGEEWRDREREREREVGRWEGMIDGEAI